jgi:lipid-A-disaccharide synthase
MTRSARVFISVAEESADAHAAALVRAARERLPGVEFYGLTGPRLRELGVETIYDFAAHAAMLGSVLGLLGRAYQAVEAVKRSWQERRPDLVVLLDSPELHLRLAKKAKRLGIPVLYYIAPQTWAAREYRNRQIVRWVDRLACILPFEEEYFQRAAHPNRDREGADQSAMRERGSVDQGIEGSRDQGIKGFRAEYVRHPLFETLRREQPVPGTVEFLKLRAAGRPIVALFPGSRWHVIETMLPKQLEVVRRLRAAGHDVYAAISCVSDERREQIRTLARASLVRESLLAPGPAGIPSRAEPDGNPAELGAEKGFSAQPIDMGDAGIDVVIADNASLLTVADLVLVASGTATLHVAYYRKPMIVMYDAGRLLALLSRLFGRFILQTPHLSLLNILAGARVVPEFMPFVRDLGQVAAVAGQLLTDATWRDLMVRQIDEVVRPLESSEASVNVCRLMGEMLGPTGQR